MNMVLVDEGGSSRVGTDFRGFDECGVPKKAFYQGFYLFGPHRCVDKVNVVDEDVTWMLVVEMNEML